MLDKPEIFERLIERGLLVALEDINIKHLENGHFFATVRLDCWENQQRAKALPRPRGISEYGIGGNGSALYLVA